MSEGSARREIIAYSARLWQRGLVAGSSGNVSLRLADGDLLITPAGVSLADLHRNEIVRVDIHGTSRDSSQHPSSELPLHLTAYRSNARVRCLIHTHPTYCVVWSKSGKFFPRDTVGARESLRNSAWTPYRDNGTQALADLCAAEFARGMNVVLMERHGLSAVGTTLEEAFLLTDQAEEAARVAAFSHLLGFHT